MALLDLDFDQLEESIYMAKQQQQQPQPPRQPRLPGSMDGGPGAVDVNVVLCIPDDQKRFIPRRARAPASIPVQALPRIGDAIYLSHDNAWAVEFIAHVWVTPLHLRIEVWLEHVHGRRAERPTGFALTQ
jgi:hypothetical protein